MPCLVSAAPHVVGRWLIMRVQGVGFVAGWRGSLGVRHAWSYGFAMAKLGDSPTEGSTWSGPTFYYLADSGMGGVGKFKIIFQAPLMNLLGSSGTSWRSCIQKSSQAPCGLQTCTPQTRPHYRRGLQTLFPWPSHSHKDLVNIIHMR